MLLAPACTSHASTFLFRVWDFGSFDGDVQLTGFGLGIHVNTT